MMSAVVLAQVLDTDNVKRYSEDSSKGRVEGSLGGRVPDKYVVVRNNELCNIRYVSKALICWQLADVVKIRIEFFSTL